MPSSQDTIFANSEGDRWSNRNDLQSERYDPRVDPVCDLIELYSLKPRKVIEVGAAIVVRLEAIRERYQAEVASRCLGMAIGSDTVDRQLRGPVAQNSFQRLT